MLIALSLTSCALFAFGTGRLNPIFVQPSAAFNVAPNETHYLNLTLPGSRVAPALPAPTQVYAPANLLRATLGDAGSRRGRISGDWNAFNLPSGWTLGFVGAAAAFDLQPRLGAITSTTVEVLSDVSVRDLEYRLNLSVPQTAAPGSYQLQGRFSAGFGASGGLRLNANVAAGPAVNNASLSVSDGSTIEVRPGGTYTLNVAQTGIFTNAAALYLGAFPVNTTDYVRARADDWRVRLTNLPPRWELEWLEGNLSLAVFGRTTSLGFSQIRTEYTLAYNELRLLLGLRAVGATPGAYALSGNLEYAGTAVEPVQWTVNVRQ
jgi:hypothetical protein